MTNPGLMNDPQREASDPAASAWVAASAGTGKTKVLTDRVLRLLLSGTRPERILCLTFTKAAAAQMAIRLDERLGKWTGLGDRDLGTELGDLTGERATPDDLKHARRLFARVLETPGGLKVQTIHSFCQSLLGRFPLEARVAPHFQVADERTAVEHLDTAREHVLARAGKDGNPDLARSVTEIAALVEERGFGELMVELTRDRGRLTRVIASPGGVDGAVANVRRRLGVGEDETRASVLASVCADGAFDGTGLRDAATAMAEGGDTDAKHGAIIGDWLAAPESRSATFEDYLAVFFTARGKGDRRKALIHKAALARAPDADRVLAEEAERLETARGHLKAIAVAESSAAVLRLSGALLNAYSEEKRRHAVLDYDDLILAARGLLHEEGVAPWVLYKLDGGLDHILLDEGQDTNPEQWEVVAALAEEFFAGEGAREEKRTVFAVGDAKQSIYSFQRADPGAYQRMRDHFAARVKAAERIWRQVELEKSYRSVPAVLDVVDAVFADARARQGLFSERIKHIPNREGHAGLVEVWPLETPEERDDERPWRPPLRQLTGDSPPERLAARIAKHIRQALDDGEVLESRARALRAGDFMVLVQRRAPFVEEIVRALKSLRVPVAGVDRMVLTEQLAVMDLMALGQFLLLPEDDLTLAVVLKSPLVGLDEEALFELAYGRGKHPLWRALGRRRDESGAFTRAHAYLSRLLARVDFERPYELYADVLDRLRGRERLVARLGREANDPIDEFLSLALGYERAHPPAMQGFLHWLEAGRAEVRRDLEQGRDEVRVMTVHGAKGLQAPVVFLPDTCRVPGQGDKLLWLDPKNGGGLGETVLWPARREREDAVSAAAREAAQTRRVEEYHRLLYVAMTRAQDRLYVCGWETTRERGEGCWYDLVTQAMVPMASEVTLEDGRRGLRHTSPQRAKPSADTGLAAELTVTSTPPRWARRPPKSEPVLAKPLTPSRPDSEEPPARSPLGPDRGEAAHRGRLVHRLLEMLPELAPSRRREAARRFLAQPAHGLSEARRAEIVAETLAVLDDPAFSRLFGPGSRAEAALAGVVGERVIWGQVDRLLVTDEEVLIVDYKTNRAPPERAEDVPEAYLRQMAAYRAALELIYPGRPVRCALLWTDGPRLMPLDNRSLAAAAP